MRLKNIYLRQFGLDEKEYEDCNFFEVIELKKRKAIMHWLKDDLFQYILKETMKKK